jgi:hypothetical protein
MLARVYGASLARQPLSKVSGLSGGLALDRGARGGDVRLHRHQGDADAQGARHSEFEHCTNDRHKAEFESV